jgi:hypothetical protein
MMWQKPNGEQLSLSFAKMPSSKSLIPLQEAISCTRSLVIDRQLSYVLWPRKRR